MFHIYRSVKVKLKPPFLNEACQGKKLNVIVSSISPIEKAILEPTFWVQVYFCVTAGALAEVMIKEYLAHHFQRKDKDNLDLE